MDAKALAEFQAFLDEPDPKVFKWLSGREPFPDKYDERSPNGLAAKLRAFVARYQRLDARLKHD